MTGEKNYYLWIARLLIGIVTAWNLQAAFTFIFTPGAYTAGFELGGVAGETAVRGTGILFLMWNVPYLAALWHPRRYRLALNLALIMQLIGVIGESLILFGLPPVHAVLRTSLLRFIFFDTAGLILLAVSVWIMKREND